MIKKTASFLITTFLLVIPQVGLADVYREADARKPTIRPLAQIQFRNIDRVMIGPDKTRFVVWENDAYSITGLRSMLPPSIVVFGRYGDPLEPEHDAMFVLSGSGLRLFPIRWDDDEDSLYLRVREPQGRVIAISSNGVLSPREYQIPDVWRKIDITSTKYGDASFFDSKTTIAQLDKFQGDEYIRGVASVGTKANFLGVRSSDLLLTKIGSEDTSHLQLPAGWTRNLTVFEQPNSSYPNGVSYLGAARTSSHAYLLYQRPLVDLSAGKVVGVFGPSNLLLDNKRMSYLSTEITRKIALHPGSVVLDASMNENVAMVLLRRADGTRSLLRFSESGFKEKDICRDFLGVKHKNVGNEIISIFRIGLNRRLSSNEMDGPAVVRISASSMMPKVAIVYFHGGPGGTLADGLWQFRARSLLQPGRDIIGFEYSGSVGVGKELSRRLAKSGAKALTRDLSHLARWLKNRGYSRIFIVDDSFGGVLGMMMQKHHSCLISASFHIAPLLKLQSPSRWSKRGNGLNPVNPNTQIAFEYAMFGGINKRSIFATELDRMMRSINLKGNTNFYFGAMDGISQPDQIPHIGGSNIITYPRVGHAVVGAIDSLWKDIDLKVANHEKETTSSDFKGCS